MQSNFVLTCNITIVWCSLYKEVGRKTQRYNTRISLDVSTSYQSNANLLGLGFWLCLFLIFGNCVSIANCRATTPSLSYQTDSPPPTTDIIRGKNAVNFILKCIVVICCSLYAKVGRKIWCQRFRNSLDVSTPDQSNTNLLGLDFWLFFFLIVGNHASLVNCRATAPSLSYQMTHAPTDIIGGENAVNSIVTSVTIICLLFVQRSWTQDLALDVLNQIGCIHLR